MRVSTSSEIREILVTLIRGYLEDDFSIRQRQPSHHRVFIESSGKSFWMTESDFERFYQLFNQKPYSSELDRLMDRGVHDHRFDREINQIARQAADEFWPTKGEKLVEARLNLSVGASSSLQTTRGRSSTSSVDARSYMEGDSLIWISKESSVSLSAQGSLDMEGEVS